MSSNAQAIFYFIALIGCLLAAFSPLRADRSVWGVHAGWLGLASFVFVAFWIAMKAA